ncbi:RNA polymerase factor sigma-54 [Bermanella marisrubri]|uniref:RNA polymerase sigma-54 factor n=1 Tax=Bermanella marisrubri TaxID=207949 RepID=Q1MYM7_9GAMM|nr:RNA polymerase factor sigma-54 [Bermanella marisrubri]EAT11089.1 DNA-directed RNA polymerase subunit N [Oceanobacter sp. RED65] [Bermanella marisrubri]QIZ83410.1 RNA polymerase factor sigma-54 [Bermanella marisrubri]
MKASLQLKMGQHLTMTPQLQQAIRLLQLSTIDLQQEIQNALDSNPLLDVEEEYEGETPQDQSTQSQSENKDTEASENQTQENVGDDATADSDWNENIPDDLPTDSDWDDTWQASASPASSSESYSGGDDFDFDSRNGSTDDLQDHLLWQLNLTPMSDNDHMIAVNIIEGVDDDGYLKVSLEDILASFDPELEIELDELEAVLHLLQQFEPSGVCARDLQECLSLQLKQLPKDTPWLDLAQKLIDNHIDLLGSKDYSALMRKLKVKEDELKIVIRGIQELNPRPGSQIAPQTSEYVIPDVIVRQVKGHWRVELNPEIAPKLRINDHYASMVKRADNSSDNNFIKDHLQEARWFLKSLQSRNETLLKVASKIVEYQQAFLEEGDEAMKPLVLHDIAEAVEMHESTISRVTTQKYMHTPRGIYELKYFFSSHVSTTSGGECSSTAIRAMIKKLIASEAAKKPLSDSKIAAVLEEEGIKVARRTVAKYREAMHIPPSNERKRLV